MVELADIAPPPATTASGEGFGEDPVYFCDGCKYKGAVGGPISEAMVFIYAVGLNCTGALGVLVDADGNRSEPIELPFKSKNAEYLESLGIKRPSEYWTNDFVGPDEVDKEGVIKDIGKCESPEITQTRFLRREVSRCPVLIASMMGRRRNKEALASLANPVTEEQG